MSGPGHEWTKHERDGWSVCSRCGMVRNYDRETTTCSGALPKIRQRSEVEDCGQDGVCKLSPGCNRHWEERNRDLVMTMTTHWADHARDDAEESDIIIAGRQVPFVQVGMIVHPDDCLNCERDGNPLWCSALVCDIHDDDETARFGMMATLLFRNGERREEPCDELRRRWRMARDFDQNRVYTGRWGAIPRGAVWPVAEVNEDA